jgi:hypothetical protein
MAPRCMAGQTSTKRVKENVVEQAGTSRVRGFAFRGGRVLAAGCLAAAAAVLVPGVAVPAGAALLAAPAGHALVVAPAWTGAEAPLPTGQKSSALSSVVCPGSSTCIAVGESILTGSGSSWSASPDPAPANAAKGLPNGQLYQVSCWSASGCVAAGEYTPKSGPTSLPLLVVKKGSTWKVVSVSLPANASKGSESLDGFFAVACQSASTCLAAGYYTDTNGETQGLLATNSGSSWTVVEAPLPSGTTSGQMVSAACPSAGVCVAGGQNADTGALIAAPARVRVHHAVTGPDLVGVDRVRAPQRGPLPGGGRVTGGQPRLQRPQHGFPVGLVPAGHQASTGRPSTIVMVIQAFPYSSVRTAMSGLRRFWF